MTASAPYTDETRLADTLASARAAGRRIVFTNGGFDLLHVGHVRMLAAAKALGDVLVVGINADAGVARAKGPGRPRVPAVERAELVAAIAGVDHVLIFEDDTVDRLLECLRPDVHAKGRDYDERTLPERETNQRLGIEMAFVGDEKERASSGLVAPRQVGNGVDRLAPLGRGTEPLLVLRTARRHLARHGWMDVARLVTTDAGTLVEGTAKRWVRRVVVGGMALYVKVTRPHENKRSPITEWHNHIALRAAGFHAPEPWLAAEQIVGGVRTGVLVTREVPGERLDRVLARRWPTASGRERLALARGVGLAVRALHAARFLQPDLQAWHLLVSGSPAAGCEAYQFIDLMRVTRAGKRLRRSDAVVGLAALALSLRPVVDERFCLAALQAYLGGSLAGARPWLAAIERRIERIQDRSTFRHLTPGGSA